jgi:uncharacterized protein
MTYAQNRKIIDADSHLLELDDFLRNAAREADLPLLQNMDEQKGLPVDLKRMERGRQLFEQRKSSPELVAESEARVVQDIIGGWARLGVFDPGERSRALDIFGYEMQLVLPTYSFHQVIHVEDPDVLEAGSRTLNTAMGEFCSRDARLKAIGYVPLTLGPETALEIMNKGLEDGCYSFMVDTSEPNDANRSYTHPDFDPVWARFAEMGIPFGIHVAANGHYQTFPKSFNNNGKDLLELGGDAPAGELGLTMLKNHAEIFFAAMIFDGVFDRHPELKGICMEHGAAWLPGWLFSLDLAAGAFSQHRKFIEKPSVTAKSRLKFSPFAGEPIGWIIDNVGPDMLVYASDFPHPEGSPDPIGRFEATMEGCDQATMDAFYHGNMQKLMGIA